MKQLLLSTTILVFTTLIISAQTVYVDIRANGDNDGSSWRDAYTSLEDALENAPEDAAIWISKGTYSVSSRQESFVIDKSLKIYGGFDGNESNLSQRDVEKNEVDLSGDVLGDDDYSRLVDNKDENSYHVITIEAGVSGILLDGLTIRGGETLKSENDVYPNNDYNGGGILSLGSSFSINNCTFYENYADNLGGAIFVDPTPGVEISITNSNFIDNGANQEGGGIMVHTEDAQLNIKGTIFDNAFARRGGIIRFRGEGAILKIEDSEFKDGLATGWGGGLSVNTALEFSMTDCIIEDNQAFEGGGGLYLFNIETATIEDCIIRNNLGDGFGNVQSRGAGIYVDNNESTLYGTNVTLMNTDILDNNSNFIGGGMMVERATVEVFNSKIEGNSAELAGGGAMVILGGDLKFTNVDLNENTSEEGGGLYYQDGANYLLKDCTISKNEATGSGGGIYVDLDAGTVLPIENSNLESNISQSSGGGIFINDGIVKISNSNLIENEAEYGGGISNNYGSTVEISDSNIENNTATITGGGLEGFDDVIYRIDNCEIKENEANYGGGIGCESAVTVTITNSEITKNTAELTGGGVNCFAGETSFEISNSVFTNNRAEFGGAIDVQTIGTIVTISGSEFIRNIAGNEGGALTTNFGAKLDLSDSRFYQNDSNRAGGAVAIGSDSIPGIRHIVNACIFDDNRSLLNDEFEDSGSGSALVLWNSTVDIQNSLFVNNSAASGGTIQPNDYDNQNNIVSITNCTFARNKNKDLGTILAWDDENGDKVNLDLQNNVFAETEVAFRNDQGEADVKSLGGNLIANDLTIEIFTHTKDQNDTDPRFKDDRDDFRLSSTSPAINAGVNANAPDTDIVGYERDLAVDIGAYESQEVTSVFNEVIPAGDLAVFPNPVSEVLKYSLESDWTGNYNLVVLNISGQKVLEESYLKSGQNVSDKMLVDHLKSGTYILQISKDKKQSNIPFIKI